MADLNLIAEVVDKSIEAGASVINHIGFGVQDQKNAKEAAYRLAMDDARWRAEVIAGELGYVTVVPIEVREGYSHGPIYTAEGGAVAMDQPGMFMPGQLKVGVNLEVDFLAIR